MSLPPNDTAWPPAEHADRYHRLAKYDAWYSGDRARLQRVYGGATGGTTTGGPGTTINPQGSRVTRAIRAGVSAFWGTPPATGESDARRHLPTAKDITVISAELLFSDPPTITVDGPRWEEDGPVVRTDADGKQVLAYMAGDPKPETVEAQERLDYLLEASRFESLCLAAAETQSAFGSVALRVAWDKARIADRPTITRVDADAMLADYAWGTLEGVTFWRVVRNDGTGVWRHLELHEGGRIYHGLYKGDTDDLGKAMPLTEHHATRDIIVDEAGAVVGFALDPVTGATPRTAVSIPNMLPDPLDRRGNVGASDYTEAVLDLLDAGDKVWSDMMMSVDDAKSRIIIAKSLLESRGPGQGLSINLNQRIFTHVNLAPTEKESGGLPMEKVQFDMRLDEYWSGIERIYTRTIQAAGYNPQTMGAERAERNAPATATEYNGNSKRSMSTRDKKIRYWVDALESLLTGLLVVDAREFASGVTPYPVRVQFPEAVQPSMDSLLTGAAIMSREKLASIETILEYIHPDWDARDIADEAERIKATTTVIDPLTFGLGGFGVPRAASDAVLPGDATPGDVAGTPGNPTPPSTA